MSRFFRLKTPAVPAASEVSSSNGPGKLESLPETIEEEQLPRTLLPVPPKPKFRIVIVQSSEQPDAIALANGIMRASIQAELRSSDVAQRRGASGKGFREDYKSSHQAAARAPSGTANGCAVDVLTWLPDDDEAAQDAMTGQLLSGGYDAVVARVQEAHFAEATASWLKLRQALRRVASLGTPVWPTLQVEAAMASKDIAVRLRSALPHMSLPDTFAYFSHLEVERGLKTTLASGPRVVRMSIRNKPSSSASNEKEGAWLVALASGNYCEMLGDATLLDSDLVYCVAMSNGHEVAPRPLKELVAFLCHGRNQKGAGDSWGYAPDGQPNQGGYLKAMAAENRIGGDSDSGSGSGSAAYTSSGGSVDSLNSASVQGGGGGIVDMRLLPETRTRGTVQFLMAGTKVVRISHATPRSPPGKRSPSKLGSLSGTYTDGSSTGSRGGYGEDDETKYESMHADDFQDVEDDKHGIGTPHESSLRSEKAKAARRALRSMFAEWGWVEARRAPTNQMHRFADLPIGASGGAGDGIFTHLRKTVEASVPAIVSALLGLSPVDTATSSSSSSTRANMTGTTSGNKTKPKADTSASRNTYGNHGPVTFASPSMTAAADALYTSVGHEETSSPTESKGNRTNANSSHNNIATAVAAKKAGALSDISIEEVLQGPLPLLWSVDFLPCSSHGIGWVLSKVQANASLPELPTAVDFERLSTLNLTEVYRICDAFGDALINAITATDQAPKPSVDKKEVTATESMDNTNENGNPGFKEPERWQHPWASAPDVAVAGSLQGSAFLRLLARSTAEECIIFNENKKGIANYDSNGDDGVGFTANVRGEDEEETKEEDNDEALWWQCPTLARVATFATAPGSDYLAEAKVSVREANELAEKAAASLASLRAKKSSMMLGMQAKGKWGRNIVKKPEHQSALQMAAMGPTIDEEEEGVDDDGAHLQGDDFHDARRGNGEGANDQGFITNSLRAIAMKNATVDPRSSDSVISHHRSSLKGPAVPKLFEELHSRDTSNEKVVRRSKLSTAAAATLATHSNLDNQGDYEYASRSNSRNRNSAAYSPLPGASADSNGSSPQSVWVASTSVRIMRPYRGNGGAEATAAETREGIGRGMDDINGRGRGGSGASRSSIAGGVGGHRNNSEHGVAMAFVHVCRWPAEGPLHVDYELTHSDSVAHYHGLALADANELNGQLLRPNPNLTAPLPRVLSVNSDLDGDEVCNSSGGSYSNSSSSKSNSGRGIQNEEQVAGLLGHRGTITFQPGQSVAALPIVIGSHQPSLAAPFALQDYPHNGGIGGVANRPTRSRLNAAAAGLASAPATTKEEAKGGRQVEGRSNTGSSGTGSTAVGAPAPAQDYLQLRLFHARRSHRGGGGGASLIEGLNTAIITAALPLTPSALKPLKKRVYGMAGGRSRLAMAALPSPLPQPTIGSSSQAAAAAGKVPRAERRLPGAIQSPELKAEVGSDYGADSEYQAAERRALEEKIDDQMEALQNEAATLREDARSLEEELWHGNSELHEFLNVMDLAPCDVTLHDVVRQLELKLEDLEQSRVACLEAAADADAAFADLQAGKPTNAGEGDGEREMRENRGTKAIDVLSSSSSSSPSDAESTRHVAAQVVGFVASEFALPDLPASSNRVPPFAVVVLSRTDAVENAAAGGGGEASQLSLAAGGPLGTSTPAHSSRVCDSKIVVDLAVDFRAFSNSSSDISSGRRRFSSSSSTDANERSWRVYRSVTFQPGEEYVVLTLPSRPHGRTPVAAESALGGGAATGDTNNAPPFAIRCRLLSAHVYLDRAAPAPNHTSISSSSAPSASLRHGHGAFQHESMGAVRFGEITEAKVVHVARKSTRVEGADFDQDILRQQQPEQRCHDKHQGRVDFSQQKKAQEQRHISPAWSMEPWSSQDNDGGHGSGSNAHATNDDEPAGDDAPPTTLAAEERAALARLADVQQQVAAAQETYVRVILEMGGALATIQSMDV